MSSTSRIVVGVDGSQAGRAALRWAADEARSRHAPVLLVHAGEDSPGGGSARTLLADAAEELRARAPEVEQDCRTSEGRPDVALLRASEDAALLVLGCHGESGARLGPVLGRVSVQAGCPVVVVRDAPQDGRSSVVVGVDGSAVSQDAVGFAFAQAWRHDLPLVAVLAVPPPFDAFLPSLVELEQIRDTGRRHLSESLAGWAELYPGVPVSQVVSLDAPLLALQAAATSAALLVVGSHGRGALLRATLGSVSSCLLRSSTAPVAVVRPRVAVDAPDPLDVAHFAPLTYL